MRPLTFAMTLLLESAICSCHTQKQSSLSGSAVGTEAMIDKSVSVSGSTSVTLSDLTGFFENVNVTFSADSVRLGDVILYGPRLAGAADSASITSKKRSMEARNDSTSQDIAIDRSVDTNLDFTENSKSVAVADTGGGFCLAVATGAAIAILLLFLWYYRKFHH